MTEIIEVLRSRPTIRVTYGDVCVTTVERAAASTRSVIELPVGRGPSPAGGIRSPLSLNVRAASVAEVHGLAHRADPDAPRSQVAMRRLPVNRAGHSQLAAGRRLAPGVRRSSSAR